MLTTSFLGPICSVKERPPRQMTTKGLSYSCCSGREAPPRRTQTRRAERSSAGSWLGRLELELCLGREKAGASSVFLKIFMIESTAS
jgi:hypothetical protein